ncbi:hypothetical protein KKI22_01890 [Patescibacteria group bacterium]|nr:hypothetical protein [Patescibacteria group bacterium]
MARIDRKKLIEQLEKTRNSKVICYIGSTRIGAPYQMTQMDVRVVYDHLKKIGFTNKIDLILSSFGGDVTFSWRLVNNIRQFCNEFNVIIPFNAFSCATLISFGADSIIMLPLSCLGPTDPQSTSSYNIAPINVEDISSFIKFVKEDFDIKSEPGLISSLELLSKSDGRIHPIALGAAKRGASLAKKYAKELLSTHKKKKIAKEKVAKIVQTFSSDLFAHDHPINRDEAKVHGLNIVVENKKTEDLIWEIFEDYENELSLNEPLDPVTEFKNCNPNPLPLTLANQLQPVQITIPTLKQLIIESAEFSDTFSRDLDVTGVKFLAGNGEIRETYSFISKSLHSTRDST